MLLTVPKPLCCSQSSQAPIKGRFVGDNCCDAEEARDHQSCCVPGGRQEVVHKLSLPLRRAALTAVRQWLSLLLEEVPLPKNLVANTLWVCAPSLSCGVVTHWCPQRSSCDAWHLYKSVTYWKHLIN